MRKELRGINPELRAERLKPVSGLGGNLYVKALTRDNRVAYVQRLNPADDLGRANPERTDVECRASF
ncbi:hypothetical protein KM043_009479 [Ampulex compressa]|nr:hypothetical protein KM043_009479 [Ampulex compressa]